jgi:hypothetical protein
MQHATLYRFLFRPWPPAFHVDPRPNDRNSRRTHDLLLQPDCSRTRPKWVPQLIARASYHKTNQTLIINDTTLIGFQQLQNEVTMGSRQKDTSLDRTLWMTRFICRIFFYRSQLKTMMKSLSFWNKKDCFIIDCIRRQIRLSQTILPCFAEISFKQGVNLDKSQRSERERLYPNLLVCKLNPNRNEHLIQFASTPYDALVQLNQLRDWHKV